MIKENFIHFESYEKFQTVKISADKENKMYTVGIGGEVQTGEPDIPYQSIVFIKDKKYIWTNGQLYNQSDSTQIPTASENILGGIKTGYTTSGRNYKVEVDDEGNAFVNVPWTSSGTGEGSSGNYGSVNEGPIVDFEIMGTPIFVINSQNYNQIPRMFTIKFYNEQEKAVSDLSEILKVTIEGDNSAGTTLEFLEEYGVNRPIIENLDTIIFSFTKPTKSISNFFFEPTMFARFMVTVHFSNSTTITKNLILYYSNRYPMTGDFIYSNGCFGTKESSGEIIGQIFCSTADPDDTRSTNDYNTLTSSDICSPFCLSCAAVSVRSYVPGTMLYFKDGTLNWGLSKRSDKLNNVVLSGDGGQSLNSSYNLQDIPDVFESGEEQVYYSRSIDITLENFREVTNSYYELSHTNSTYKFKYDPYNNTYTKGTFGTDNEKGYARGQVGFCKTIEDLEDNQDRPSMFSRIINGRYIIPKDTYVPWGFLQTLYIIKHRNSILPRVMFNLNSGILKTGLDIPREVLGKYTELDMLKKLIDDVTFSYNDSIYSELYYPAASLCNSYAPGIIESRGDGNNIENQSIYNKIKLYLDGSLHPDFREHNWYLPSIGEIGRIAYYNDIVSKEETFIRNRTNLLPDDSDWCDGFYNKTIPGSIPLVSSTETDLYDPTMYSWALSTDYFGGESWYVLIPNIDKGESCMVRPCIAY